MTRVRVRSRGVSVSENWGAAGRFLINRAAVEQALSGALEGFSGPAPVPAPLVFSGCASVLATGMQPGREPGVSAI